MEIVGKIIEVLPEQSGTSARGDWKRRGFVIETQDTYPKKIAMDIFNKPELVIPNIGTEATVNVNIESREHNGRWYTSITAWKIEGFSTPNQNTSIPPAPTNEPKEQDDLPF